MNELITVVLMYVPLKVAVTLDNVPEGLWARKVEAGGMEGFTEKLLGIEFEQVGHEIRVTKSLGFASSRKTHGQPDPLLEQRGELLCRARETEGRAVLRQQCAGRGRVSRHHVQEIEAHFSSEDPG